MPSPRTPKRSPGDAYRQGPAERLRLMRVKTLSIPVMAALFVLISAARIDPLSRTDLEIPRDVAREAHAPKFDAIDAVRSNAWGVPKPFPPTHSLSGRTAECDGARFPCYCEGLREGGRSAESCWIRPVPNDMQSLFNSIK